MALAEAVRDGWNHASLLVLAAILDTFAIGDGDGLPSAVLGCGSGESAMDLD